MEAARQGNSIHRHINRPLLYVEGGREEALPLRRTGNSPTSTKQSSTRTFLDESGSIPSEFGALKPLAVIFKLRMCTCGA